MGQEFRITITAADRASEIIDQINAKLDRITQPIERTRKAAGLLDKEKGITNAANDILKMGRATAMAEKGFGGMMGAVVGVAGKIGPLLGPGGVIGGAMTVIGAAGAYAAGRWGKFGFEIDRTSKLLGISTRDLQRYRLAAEMLGVSRDKTTSALHSFGLAAQGAEMGRNQGAMYGLSLLGLGVRRLPGGGPDTPRMLEEVIDRLGSKSVPVQAKEAAAGLLGLSDWLPVLIEGSERLKDKLALADESGAITSDKGIKAAEKLLEAQKLFNAELDGTVVKLREELYPWYTGFLELGTSAIRALKSGEMWKPAQAGFYTPEGGFIWGESPLSGAGDKKTSSPARRWGKAAAGGSPLGIRHNNPGNLRRWGNAPVVNGFARFATPEEGLSAMTGNLQSYGAKGYNTIGRIINRWAPESDNNNTGAYVAHVSRLTGFAPNQQLDMNDQATLEKLVSAIIQHENGKNPYSKEMISRAISSRTGNRRDYVTAMPPMIQQGADDTTGTPAGASGKVTVDVNFQNAPPGTMVTAQTDSQVNVSTRIGYSNPGTL